MTMITPSYLGETIEYSSLHACRSTLEDPTSIRETVWKALGEFPPRPHQPQLRTTALEPRTGLVARFEVNNGNGVELRGILALPRGVPEGEKLPAVMYLADGDPLAPGPDGLSPALALARHGFAVIAPEVPAGQPLAEAPWGEVLRNDLVCLDALLTRPEIDPKRVAVGGSGLGGTRAWWLLALDERLVCGSAAGGMTRLRDWQAAQGKSDPALAPWVARLRAHFDTEAIIALCAPRSFEFMVGTEDPSAPLPGVLVLRDTARRAYSLVRPPGHHMEAIFDGLGATFTLLEWDMMLELFDKELKPQGPTPLGHTPEPEPMVDDRFLDPAAHGLAGWVPEMSQRPTTWRWDGGTIVCAPGPNEYGWLRAPIEVDDFILSLEWKIPANGNTGVFLRARPVDWYIAPSAEAKWRVAARGLEWPSRTGLELQVTDDAGQANKYSSGSLYRHAAPAENVVRPSGEWNRYTVRCRGPRVEVWCNGRQVLDTTIDQYATLRNPPLRGYFGLQNHGVGAEFRNLRYLRLSPGSDPAAATSR